MIRPSHRRSAAESSTLRSGSDAARSLPFLGGLRAFVAGRIPVQDVDDVTQDLLLRLVGHSSGPRQPAKTQAWVFAIARRAVADYYRARQRLPEHGADSQEADFVADEARVPNLATFDGDHDVHEEVLSWLRPMVDELAPTDRQALIAVDFDGHSQQQLANELGLSLSGAKSRIQRARARLGERLKQCCAIELGLDGKVVDFERLSCSC